MAIQFDWIGKRSSYRSGSFDVGVAVHKNGIVNGVQKYTLTFTFMNGSHKKITNGDYIKYAIVEDLGRIYFSHADNSGLKLSKNNNSVIMYSVIRDKEQYSHLIGDYNLLKDNDEHLYYIDLDRREGRE